jgi:uncharacterized protein (TIGR02147 family)
MTKKNLHNYRDYKAYIKDFLKALPRQGHGYRTQIASALNCNSAYVSQVLNAEAQFNLEQAESLNSLFKHSSTEASYFRLLVQFARAGTQALREALAREIVELQKKNEKLSERVERTESLTEAEQMRYYSHWYYAAVHIATTIPHLQTKEDIRQNLNLSSDQIEKVLNFLVEVGLVEYTNEKYKASKKRLFLTNDSPMIKQHHTNWRLKSLQALDSMSDKNLNFTTCVSLSKEDFSKIKDILVEAINSSRGVIKESNEEILCGLSVDFYSILDQEKIL